MFDLSGKCALVIGGTSGIGKAIAMGLAEAGADVIATSRSPEGTSQTSHGIEALGRRTLNISSDVTNTSSLLTLRDRIAESFPAVDILVNCAGITRRAPTLDFPEACWNQIFDVNLNGTMRACQIFGSGMIARGKGKIINIASLSTFVAFHEVAAYGASKAAIGALTKSLAVEWAPFGIQVNAIAPGIFETSLNRSLLDSPRGNELKMRTPAGRFGETSELVSTALYLAADESSFTTGQIIAVDGGFMASGVNQ